MPAGRPTLFKPEYIEQAKKFALLGATDKELADLFEVDVRTIYRWKLENEEFCQSLKIGKDIADERVERSLYQRAIGYEQDEVKIFMPAGFDKPVYAPFVAKIPPDTTAGIFWLKNRKSQEWRDKQDIDMNVNADVTSRQITADMTPEQAAQIYAEKYRNKA